MNIHVHRKASGGFTLAEVTMAVGIVAFGLVAVLSILPFGLTAQKDNREETIIRYEAQYWFAALQSGGLLLEEMDRVERVELTDANATNPITLENPGGSLDWQVNVCGWLSARDNVVKAKFARVWAFNGSLFDRLNPGEFSFSYFMGTHVEPIGNSGSRITLTFHWPITGPIEEAINSGISIYDIVNGQAEGLAPPANEKTFSTLTSLNPERIISSDKLSDGLDDNRQNQFLRTGLPGQKVSITGLREYFATVLGERLSINVRDNKATVNALGVFSDKDISRYNGWYINIKDVEGDKSYRILGVAEQGNGHKIQLDLRKNPPVVPNGMGLFDYRVTFLNEHPKSPKEPETWPKLLKKWMEEGLGTFEPEQWTYGFISPSIDSNSSSWILK